MDTEAPTHLDACRARFDMNLGRVENLIEIFEGLKADNAKSRDILRAAVMLLHASIEDVLRQLLLYRMPTAPVELLTMYFTDQHGKTEKMDIGELAKLHKVSLEHEIHSRMKRKMAHSNYNDKADVVGALKILGFAEADVAPLVDPLKALMSRRHLIVHRSDREEARVEERDGKKTSHGRPRQIDIATVNGWVADVRRLVDYAIDRVDDPLGKMKATARLPKSKIKAKLAS